MKKMCKGLKYVFTKVAQGFVKMMSLGLKNQEKINKSGICKCQF
jgi:hypothetical protein